MSLLVDVSPLMLRSAGVKAYVWHWARALMEAAGPEAVRTFPRVDFSSTLNHERSMAAPLETFAGLATLYATNYMRLPVLRMRLGGARLFHATNQVRRPPRVPLLTSTLHDLTCWSMPEMHTEGNIRADAEFAERVWKRADALIAVSGNTRRDAIEYLKLPPERVIAIHSGVSDAYFDVTEADARSAVLKHSLTKPFVLVVGTIEPRKNTSRLLDAWAALPGRLRREYDLVFAGPAGWAPPETIERLKRGAGAVRWLGYVDERDLPGLTRAAEVAAYPSLYEGFGFPVAQAMATGTAVLTSNVSSLPEVGADGCEYADPRDVESIASALGRLLESDPLRTRLGAAGAATARARYRWNVCALKSLDLFRRLGAL
jgi:alpha-1,3-rhamnosyl/mannosyltransferase